MRLTDPVARCCHHARVMVSTFSPSRGADDGQGEDSAALIPQVRTCDLQKHQLYAILVSIGHVKMGGKGS